MNVMPEWNAADDLGTTVIESGDSAAAAVPEQAEAPASLEAGGSAAAGPESAGSASAGAAARELPAPGHADSDGAPMAGIAASVRELADSAERYHARAEQRENVIDHLRTEVERLRRGERRGLLRPLLAEICRLRNDLLRQAGELPEDFDTERAALLLRSYAESVELALENSGVVTFAPDRGDAFDPRMHRRVGVEPAVAPAVPGRIARVRRDGYLDVDANSPIAPAEVVVFAATAPESSQDTQDKREEQ
jgi:molecular chaperone GrpE